MRASVMPSPRAVRSAIEAVLWVTNAAMAQEEACEGDQHGWGGGVRQDRGWRRPLWSSIPSKGEGKGICGTSSMATKEVLWKQTEPCVALLQITSEMTATTQGRGKRGSFGSFGRKKKEEQHLDESYQTY